MGISNTKKGVVILCTALFSLSASTQPLLADKKTSEQNKTIEAKVEVLLSKMTLDEKIGQLNQLSYIDISPKLLRLIDDKTLDDMLLKMKLHENPSSLSREAKEQMIISVKRIIAENTALRPLREGKVGSFLNTGSVDLVNEAQKIAKEENRLGIPLIIGRDVIHGFRTIFPIPLGQAASFNPEMVMKGARIAAVEATETGVRWTFAPMIDISRDARWGRIAESIGEDPYLTAIMGVAMVKGFQGENLSDPTSLAACAKHFVGYGAAEGGRDYNSTNIPLRLMRNVYLYPFRKAVDAGVASLMTSFNDNDGVPASGNPFLLRDVLRKEWGFDGLVVSDWNSMGEMIPHGYVANLKEVAKSSIDAGVDMDMASNAYITYLKELIAEGKVSEELVNEAVRNILRVKYRLGLFENPYTDTSRPSTHYAPEHLEAAKQMAIQSAILLKNENRTLPLSKNTKIAIIGPMADAPHDQMGTWSFDGQKEKTITPIIALKGDYKNINYIYEPGLKFSRDKDTSFFEKAKQAAQSSDVAVVFLGEEAVLSGEAHSLSNINLIGAQSELLKAVKSTGKPVVLVVMAGRPLTIERDLPYADAVLYAFHPGTMGGPAILDLIFGDANPSGKLPVTFVREVGQIPLYYNHNNTGRPSPDTTTHIDDIPLEAGQTSLGNTSFYLDSGKNPLFPFGYGLSYSKFEYSNLELSSNTMPMGGSIIARINIKNTGSVTGTEVTQLYIRDLVGSIARPVKELKGFERVTLQPNESKVVEFKLTTDDLAFYGYDMTYKTEPGDFNLWIGTNSNEGLQTSFSIK